MTTDYKKEWVEKSSIDYFSPFISLWLACNSWYMSHYSDLNDNHTGNNTASDRAFINKLKEDTSGRNHLYTIFSELIEKIGKDGIAFRTDIELLHYALERANLQPDRIGRCSLCSAVVEYKDKDNPVNLIKTPRIKQDGSVYSDDEADVIKLDQIYISSNLQHCFAGILEVVYQVRNMLVHGKLNPDKDEHDVVKYCYRILWELMN
jgi:hypothetical protein